MKTFFFSGRTKNYLNQLTASTLFKFSAAILSFALIPIILRFLGSEIYGVWSTLLSILSWIAMLDLGIGNGLRNKISESIAKNKLLNAQEFVSTSYVILIGVVIVIGVIIFIASGYIPWQIVFNTKLISAREIALAVNITSFFVLTNFVLSLVNQVAHGVQKTATTVINQFLANLISLVLICFLSIYGSSSIAILASAYGFSITLANLIITKIFYKEYSFLIPKISLFNKKSIKTLLALGLKFFVLQIAVVVLFTTDKLIITQFLGPVYVTQYDVVFKLFTIISVIHGLLVAPLWTAYSDAYHKGDYQWIRSMMKTQVKIFGLLVLFTLVLLLMVPTVIQLWIGPDFHAEWKLFIAAAVFVLFLSWNNIFALFLNGIDQLKVQLRTSMIAMLVNIPMSIFFIQNLGMGNEGVLLATILSLSLFSIFGPIESFKLINKFDYEDK